MHTFVAGFWKSCLWHYQLAGVLLPLLILMLTIAPAEAWQRDAQKLPYQALVRADDAIVRSGPAKVHYGTHRLSQGDSVEVYRHDPGGWCAIRPPAGSFSLMPASTVEMVREGVGQVTVDDARAWVGTRLGPVPKPLWQVKLRKGELITVIGETTFPDPDGFSTVWYQVEPPPGEFRWIHCDDLRSLHTELPEPALQKQPEVAASVLQPSVQTGRAAQPLATQPPTMATPKPDLPTRAPRVVGSGLRVDLANAQRKPQRDISRLPQRRQPPNLDPPSESAYEVRQAAVQNFQSDSAFAGDSGFQANAKTQRHETDTPNDSQVQLASGTQDLVLPVDRDGINQGWRPSQRARREGSLSNTFDRPSQSSIASSGELHSQNRNSGSKSSFESWNVNSSDRESKQVSPWSPPQESQTDAIRYADAQPTSSQMARELELIRALPAVSGSYLGDLGSIKELEAALTREMLKPDPTTWQLDSLVSQIRLMQSRKMTPEQQNNLSRMLEKVQNCQRLNAMYSRGTVSQVGTQRPMSPVEVSQSDAAFDATGWLSELKRDQGLGTSTYVLQDDSGKITHHLMPAPGVNLTRYLKQKVGVVGRRGYHQGLKLAHVEVNRVFGL